jgi:hypothetical protein
MPMKEAYTGGWWLYSGLTADQLGAKLSEHDAHISEIEAFMDGNILRFSAILLKNRNTSHWWYFGLTGDQVGAKLGEHGAVPTSLCAYGQGSNVRFAVVMQKRPEQGYWWYFGLTADELGAKFGEHDAMPVEITPYDTGAGLRFAAIMVPRGTSGSWWYFGQKAADIGERLNETDGQLDLIRSYPTHDGNRYVIAIKKPASPPAWWWYFGQSIDDIFTNARINGTYVSDLTTYLEGSNRRYACVMHPRTFATTNPAQHAKIRDMLGASHIGGWHGFYLRRIGGHVIQAFNETTVFDPASAMKSLVYAHAMRAVQDKQTIGNAVVTLNTTIPVPPGIGSLPTQGTDCPFDEVNTAAADQIPCALSTAMESMMQRSRNATTEAIRRYFGIAAVAATAAEFGMGNTRHNGPTGCARNESTLVDFGKLYERCSNGYLDATHWQAFQTHALGQPLNEVVDICRTLATAAGLPSSFGNAYRAQMLSVHKGGRGADSIEKKCVVGYIAIPFCENGHVTRRDYVYGVFVDYADSGKIDDGFNQNLIAAEMLRDEIEASVASFVSGTCTI